MCICVYFTQAVKKHDICDVCVCVSVCVYFTQAVKKHDIRMCAHVYIYGDILMC